MIANFLHHAPTRLVFGGGTAMKAGAEAAALGFHRILLVSGRGPTRSSPGYARVRASLEKGGIAVESYAEVGADPSVEEVLALAQAIHDAKADGIVAYGGGSPIDCAKSASLFLSNSLADAAPHPGAELRDFLSRKLRYTVPGLPLMAIPTTAGSGSEMSAAAVTTDRQSQRKIGVSSEFIFPRVAIVDPELQATMPPALTAATGMDALTHTIESAVSRNATPISRALSGLAAGLIAGYFKKAYDQGDDIEARGAMALASAIAGAAMSQAGLGMVHGFAHPVGAIGGIPHGLANAVLLPFVMKSCMETAPEPFAELARDFGVEVEGMAAAEGARRGLAFILELRQALGIPKRLGELGLERSSLPAILEDAKSYRMRGASPRTFSDEELEALLERAYQGEP